jgi:hypothetical protein
MHPSLKSPIWLLILSSAPPYVRSNDAATLSKIPNLRPDESNDIPHSGMNIADVGECDWNEGVDCTALNLLFDGEQIVRRRDDGVGIPQQAFDVRVSVEF